MTFQEIKAAVKQMEVKDQRKVVLELLPEIWLKIVGDEACLDLLRKMVDEEAVRKYKEEHMDHF